MLPIKRFPFALAPSSLVLTKLESEIELAPAVKIPLDAQFVQGA